jgi:hypothetical protein
VPDQLRKIIMRCLRKDPDRRFQHIGDIRIALEELREDFELAKKARVVTAPLVEAGKVRYRRTALVGGIISLILLGVFGTVLWFASREPSESLKPLVTNQAPNTRLRLLVSLEGEASDPALSPDGKSLAYVAENGGQKDLFLARVAGGRRIQLTNDEASEADPKFSPDGERIAYISPGSGVNSSSLRILPALGGQASHVIDDAVTATWSPEGNQLAFVLRRPNEGDFIAICAADGTGLHRIMNSDVKYPFFRSVSWSPDGKQLAVERSAGGIAGEIWLVPLSGGAPYRCKRWTWHYSRVKPSRCQESLDPTFLLLMVVQLSTKHGVADRIAYGKCRAQAAPLSLLHRYGVMTTNSVIYHPMENGWHSRARKMKLPAFI